ncbi:MBL fold metallo-hydrolase [Reichenbachiella sp. MALMAid0571]|uniref:MBL fold metallo-hydrolase n=1 Tax=Reichenbachiella sp. MALMAid0571 TaxID=3143939 RepID=UPI0032E0400E
MIQIKKFVFNPFMENTYVVYDESLEAIVIDPGCYEREEQEELSEFIETEKLKVVKLLNTHCHIDHVLGNQYIKDRYGVGLYIHPKDEETLLAVKVYAPAYGFAKYNEATLDGFFEEGDTIPFGNSSFEVIFVPGHAPGHVAFVNKEQKVCIGGDVLFDGSIGRTDLPGGNFEVLINSIHEKMFTLDDSMVVYPGHGGETTIGKEKTSNPFCAIKK